MVSISSGREKISPLTSWGVHFYFGGGGELERVLYLNTRFRVLYYNLLSKKPYQHLGWVMSNFQPRVFLEFGWNILYFREVET